ncbi:cysteine desulfurase family protein [Pseudothermotoga thermarum]|uniref:Aminotransferase class V n=1 Tax=Pseudothermotoga thermarum DSM 5069 TaxID=688269 RepID=F7YXB1_9THEM|nr:cysteine desulfurase family protein [Pseudothermotoga thermarum]AEH51478.1 aminotransferase class V [Pseudothermotoga thermarum DSM 5069]
MKEVYLDNSSTTKALDEVIEAMVNALKVCYGNPSSLHRKGIEAEKIVLDAREKIAKALQVKPSEIYFTSGGTESNNLAIKGVAYAKRKQGNHLITSQIEHPSVLEVFKQLENEGFKVTYIPVDKEGHVDLEQLEKSITPETILVSIMYVNNEVGSIQPMEEIVKIVSRHENITLHVDAVQAFGKIPLLPSLKGIDLLSISAHKIYGPKGIGALFIREKTKIVPLFNGGGQEKGIRPGTENVPGIAGFSAAVEVVFKNFEEWTLRMRNLKNHLRNRILTEIDGTVLNGPKDGAPHILNISFLGVKSEVLLHTLEVHGIYVSSGSACLSKKGQKSHVLLAMKKKDEEIDGAIRFSLSPFLTFEDIDYTVEVLKKEVAQLRKYAGR